MSESSDLTSANHGFVDNTIVFVSGDFVAEVDTLSINTPYYVKKVDVDEFSLHQSSVDVDSGANTIAITNFADTSKNLIVTTAITSLVVAEANGSGAVTINKKAFTVTLDIPELNTDVWVEYKITNNKVLADSVIMANTDKAASVIIHTVIGQGDATTGSFIARITSLSGPINTDVKFNCVIL